jgi:hypothetical protein
VPAAPGAFQGLAGFGRAGVGRVVGGDAREIGGWFGWLCCVSTGGLEAGPQAAMLAKAAAGNATSQGRIPATAAANVPRSGNRLRHASCWGVGMKFPPIAALSAAARVASSNST